MPTFDEWMEDAEQYVTNAKTLRGIDDREVMVQLQQAAEYSLKAVQTARTGSHRERHDLIGLAHEVGVPSRFHRTLTYLEQAYTRRYPDEGDFEVEQPDTRIAEVERLLQWASNHRTTDDE